MEEPPRQSKGGCIKRSKLIKSKARVKKFAEVFTPDWIVTDMVEAVGEDTMFNPETTVLEPSVGTGNFFVYILRERLKRIPKEYTNENIYKAMKSLETLYGIEIQEDNVLECRERLLAIMEDFFREIGAYVRADYTEEFRRPTERLLRNRIKQGDFLKITGSKDASGKTVRSELSKEEISKRLAEFFKTEP